MNQDIMAVWNSSDYSNYVKGMVRMGDFQHIPYKGKRLQVKYWEEKNGISLVNDKTLINILQSNHKEAYEVAEMIKNNYEAKRNQPLNITTTSLALEILTHAVADKVFPMIESLSPFIPDKFKSYLEKQEERADITDAGEDDSDRAFYEWLEKHGAAKILL